MAFLGKTGLIVSAGMLLAGGILLSIGAANGGVEQVRAMARNGELSVGGNHLFYHNRDMYMTETAIVRDYEVANWAAEYGVPVSEVQIWADELQAGEDSQWWEYGGEAKEIAKKDEIENLVIDWGNARNESLDIYPISGDYFEVLQEDTLYEAKGDTLKISSKNDNSYCILYIPEDWVGEEITIKVGAGSVITESLHAENIKINIGAGYMQISSLEAEQLDIKIGAGSFENYQFLTEDAQIEIGMGSVLMDGTITGDLKVDCGMGYLMMHLRGEESDHNYKVSSTGNLNIGTFINQYGLKNQYEINNYASSDFEIKCGLGNIEIYFDESN